MKKPLHQRDFVVFDLDGTLIDSSQDIASAQVYALTAVAGLESEEIDRAKLARLLGKGLEQTFAPFLRPEQMSLLPDLVDAYRTYYKKNMTIHTHVFPGMVDVLQAVKEAGKLTAVATTKWQFTTDGLVDYFGLRPYLDFVQGSDETNFPLKPDPYILNLLMQKAGKTKEETVMVGDTDNDVLCAQGAGANVIAVTWGAWGRDQLENLKPDALATSQNELLNYLLG